MNSNDSDKTYEILINKDASKGIGAATFSKSIYLFVKTGHIDGLDLLISQSKPNILSEIGQSSLLLIANTFKDGDISVAMIRKLLPYYAPDSLNVNVAVKQSILNGRLDNTRLLAAHASQEIKNESLGLIISAHKNCKDNSDQEKLIATFKFLIDNGADVTFRDFHLYDHALNNKSAFFIELFCEKYPHIVQLRRALFCSFCIETDASNAMVDKLICAGASLKWLEKRHWTKALKNHKTIYETEGLDAKDYSIILFSSHKEQATEYIDAEAIDDFVMSTLPLFFNGDDDRATNDANTVTKLVIQGVIDGKKTLKNFMDFAGDNSDDELTFLYDHMKINNNKMLTIMIALSLKSGNGIPLFSMLKEDGNTGLMVYFAKVGIFVPEFASELIEYISIFPQLVDLISGD